VRAQLIDLARQPVVVTRRMVETEEATSDDLHAGGLAADLAFTRLPGNPVELCDAQISQC
jgi:hypothetical protein